jgi:hypothetical protein
MWTCLGHRAAYPIMKNDGSSHVWLLALHYRPLYITTVFWGIKDARGRRLALKARRQGALMCGAK